MPSSPSPSGPSRRPITVLQVIPALDTGGAERTTVDIAAALVRRGDRALVATAGGRLLPELEATGATVVPMPVGAKGPFAMLRNAWRLARLVRAEGVDLVHARSRAPAWAARLASRRTGVPFVTTFHGIYGERNALKRRYNSVMASGDVVIANSAYTAGLVAARYGTPETRIAVIPRGTDPARFDRAAIDPARTDALRRAWGVTEGRPVVLHLARLAAWKGQRVLIEAAALPPLSSTGADVLLAGDAQGREDYRAELQASIARLGLGGRVRLVGHCDDAPAALVLADVVVIASTEPEAFGRTATEAAAMGVPVVATALGATGETVRSPPAVGADERTGWLVPPGDAEALSGAIAEALQLAPEARAALAERARAHATGFTTEAMQAATLAVYDRLLATDVAGDDRIAKR